MFGPSFDVKSSVYKVLNKRIREAQAEMDKSIEEADKFEEAEIKRLKAETLNKKFEVLERVVGSIIK